MEDSDEEDVINADGTPHERLSKMYEKKDDLLANLQHIDESLAKLGYSIDSVATKAAKTHMQTGIRMDKELSFRGKAMAAEYFRRLDEDNDGLLGWEDFRAMRSVGADFLPSLAGLVHDTEYLTWESWKMHIADMGVELDYLGRLNEEQFVKCVLYLTSALSVSVCVCLYRSSLSSSFLLLRPSCLVPVAEN